MKFGSLFAGIGGFDLGLERVGFECVWQCEIDKYACQILENHWPNVRRYSDVKNIEAPERTELICGGFPCQDLSIAGRRAGLSGERSGLFFEAVRIIDNVKPKWIILENVQGLLSSHQGRDMATVIETLTEVGYCVAWRVLDSQFFGVAQRRKRVFIVGSFGNPSAVNVLFEPESLDIDSPKSRRERYQPSRTVGSLTARDFKGIGATIDDTLIIDPHSQGEPRFYENQTPTLNTNQGGQRQPCVVIKICNTKAHGDNIKSDNTSFTFQRNGGQAVVQDKIRRLTPLEYERLQGFPDNWTAVLSDTQRYKTLGNAVTVNVIEWIAKRIKEQDEAIS